MPPPSNRGAISGLEGHDLVAIPSPRLWALGRDSRPPANNLSHNMENELNRPQDGHIAIDVACDGPPSGRHQGRMSRHPMGRERILLAAPI